MPATFNWCEDNGTGAGSPAIGATRTGFAGSDPPIDVSWKTADDAKTAGAGTLYSASTIAAGANSMAKYQYGRFSGTYTTIDSLVYAWVGANGADLVNNLPATCTLYVPPNANGSTAGPVYPTGARSAASIFSGGVAKTAPVAIGSGQTVNIGGTGPEAVGTNVAIAGGTPNPCFTSYLPTQIAVGGAVAGGQYGPFAMLLRYNET